MIIIVEVPQDPTDIVLQGAVIGDVPLGGEPQSRTPWFIMQGEIRTSAIAEIPVPRDMIGQHDWYGILPRTIGPKVMSGGEVVMLDIGKKPVNVFVGPTKKWENSVFAVDQSGFGLTLYDAKTIGAPEPLAQYMVPEPETMGNPVITIPRGAIYRSGLIKRTTVPILPDSFGRHTVVDDFTETTRRWFITGVTKDSVGAPLGNCRVVAMRTDRIGINTDQFSNPILADAISDGNGNFSIQVNTNIPFQLMGYKVGSPDVAGVTVNTVIPTDG